MLRNVRETRRFQRITERQMSRRYQSAVYRELAGLVAGAVHGIGWLGFWLAVLLIGLAS